MKLPRWVTGGLNSLSILAVLGATFWAWVEWPRYTARRFVEFISQGRTEEAKGLLQTRVPGPGFECKVADMLPLAEAICRIPTVSSEQRITFESRSLWDILIGRCSFRIFGSHPIVTERGKIPDEPVPEEDDESFTFSIAF